MNNLNEKINQLVNEFTHGVFEAFIEEKSSLEESENIIIQIISHLTMNFLAAQSINMDYRWGDPADLSDDLNTFLDKLNAVWKNPDEFLEKLYEYKEKHKND
jgi:hypothetical protein